MFTFVSYWYTITDFQGRNSSWPKTNNELILNFPLYLTLLLHTRYPTRKPYVWNQSVEDTSTCAPQQFIKLTHALPKPPHNAESSKNDDPTRLIASKKVTNFIRNCYKKMLSDSA